MKSKSTSNTFFVIPGFGMGPRNKSFGWLKNVLERRGFRVLVVPIRWRYRTLSQNTQEFLEFFEHNKTQRNQILGFSYGAVIALLSGHLPDVTKMYMCSLSPDFVEDRVFMNRRIQKYIGKRRFADTKVRSGRIFARKLKIPTIVFYGEKEGSQYPQLKKRCEETVRLASEAKLVVVKGAPHQIDFPAYIDAIKKEIA